MPFSPDLLDALPATLRVCVLKREAAHQQHPAAREQHIATRKQHIATREQYIATREQYIAALEQCIGVLEEQFRLAQLKRFAPSSEKHGVQGCLFNEAESGSPALTTPDHADTTEAADGTPSPGKKRGRHPLPAHLRRKRVEHDLPNADKVCSCCQGTSHRMGEDVTEQLHIVPAQVSVLQHMRFKYACRHCERHAQTSRIVTSPMPAQPIPGSIASASRWPPS